MAFTLQNTPTKTKILALAILIFVSLTVFSLLSLVLIGIFFGNNVIQDADFLNDLENPSSVISLKAMQLLNSIGLFIIPSLVFAKLESKKPFAYLKLTNKTKILFFLVIPLLMICCSPLINILAEFNLKMHLPDSLRFIENWMKESEKNAENITKAFLDVTSAGQLLFNLFLIGIIPAIGEELLFRGIIQKLMTKACNSNHLGIWISAILFSAMHLQFYGFIPRMLMGALFGYLLFWTQNLWIPVLAHFINNAVAVITSFLIHTKKISPESENMGIGQDDILYIILGILTVSLLLFFIYENRYRENPENLVEN